MKYKWSFSNDIQHLWGTYWTYLYEALHWLVCFQTWTLCWGADETQRDTLPHWIECWGPWRGGPDLLSCSGRPPCVTAPRSPTPAPVALGNHKQTRNNYWDTTQNRRWVGGEEILQNWSAFYSPWTCEPETYSLSPGSFLCSSLLWRAHWWWQTSRHSAHPAIEHNHVWETPEFRKTNEAAYSG